MITPHRKAKQLGHKHRKRTELRIRILGYLSTHHCVGCGESDPLVLEFDHVKGQKLKDVSRLVNDCVKWGIIQKEIEKCVVLCANCHRRKTHKQLGFWKNIGESYNGSTSAFEAED